MPGARPAFRHTGLPGWTARLLVCVGLLLASGPAAFARDDQAECRLTAPQEWRNMRVEWIGPCAGGVAQGAGVAIARPERGPQQSFFGNAAGGRLTEGVFDLQNGYKPARFKDGVFVPLDDRNQIIAAFRVAANAARQVSARYKAARDMKAAREYAETAERLANQMD